MAQDILDELLQTEKTAGELISRAEKAAELRIKAAEKKIQQMHDELKQELKQKRQTLKADIEAECAREAAKVSKKTDTKLEELKVTRSMLDKTAAYLAQKILA